MNKKQNYGKVLAVQDLRRSGAAGRHADRRTKRVRTRAAAKRQAISAGW
jgi:hypothetical protein